MPLSCQGDAVEKAKTTGQIGSSATIQNPQPSSSTNITQSTDSVSGPSNSTSTQLCPAKSETSRKHSRRRQDSSSTTCSTISVTSTPTSSPEHKRRKQSHSPRNISPSSASAICSFDGHRTTTRSHTVIDLIDIGSSSSAASSDDEKAEFGPPRHSFKKKFISPKSCNSEASSVMKKEKETTKSPVTNSKQRLCNIPIKKTNTGIASGISQTLLSNSKVVPTIIIASKVPSRPGVAPVMYVKRPTAPVPFSASKPSATSRSEECQEYDSLPVIRSEFDQVERGNEEPTGRGNSASGTSDTLDLRLEPPCAWSSNLCNVRNSGLIKDSGPPRRDLTFNAVEDHRTSPRTPVPASTIAAPIPIAVSIPTATAVTETGIPRPEINSLSNSSPMFPTVAVAVAPSMLPLTSSQKEQQQNVQGSPSSTSEAIVGSSTLKTAVPGLLRNSEAPAVSSTTLSLNETPKPSVSSPLPGKLKSETPSCITTSHKLVTMSMAMPLPIITYTEEDRRNKRYVDLLLCACASPDHSADTNLDGVRSDIFAHRIMLQQIPFVQKQLSPNSLAAADVISIPGLNAAAVEAVVRMYYSRELFLKDTFTLEDLLAVVEKFEIQSLISCWTLKATAEEKQNKKLLDIINSYIIKNLEKAIDNPLVSNVSFDEMNVYMTEAVKTDVPHVLLLKAVVTWAIADLANRKDQIYPLVLVKLDLGKIFDASPRVLRQAFAPGSLLSSIPDCVQLHNQVLANKAYEMHNASGSGSGIDNSADTFADDFKVKREEMEQKCKVDWTSPIQKPTSSMPYFTDHETTTFSVKSEQNAPILVTKASQKSYTGPMTAETSTSMRTDIETTQFPASSSNPVSSPVIGVSATGISPTPTTSGAPSSITLNMRTRSSSTQHESATVHKPESNALVGTAIPDKTSNAEPCTGTTSTLAADMSQTQSLLTGPASDSDSDWGSSNPTQTAKQVAASSLNLASTSSPPATRFNARERLEKHVLVYAVIKNGARYLEGYDFKNNTLHKLHKVKRPREFSSMVQVGNCIYDIGGSSVFGMKADASIWGTMDSSDHVDIFTGGRKEPQPAFTIRKARRCFSAVVSSAVDSIYVIGGDMNDKFRNVVVTNVVEKLDLKVEPSKRKWKGNSFLHFPRSCHASAFFGDTLYTAGGIGIDKGEGDGNSPNAQALKEVEKYCSKDTSWLSVQSMNVGRRCFKLFPHGNRLYAIGGEDKVARLLTSVEVYDADMDKWELVAPMNHGRAYYGVFEMNGLIYVVGGNGTDPYEQSMECYNPTLNTWTLIPWPKDLNRSGRFHSSIAISRDYVPEFVRKAK